MDLQLKGKRALVTGSSSGIGEGTARLLAAEGCAVVVHGRRDDGVARVVAAIEAAGGTARGALGDLSNDEGAAAAATQALAAFDGLDILVNNAGVLAPSNSDGGGWFDEGGASHAAALHEANVGSMIRMVRHVVPGMRDAGWGRIVNLGSTAAVMPAVGVPHYSVTKAANVSQAVSLAGALAGTGITVNTVSPGIILTPVTEPMIRGWAAANGWGDDWEVIEHNVATQIFPNLNRRIGTPADVAYAIAFLCSPLAVYVNGANLRVDGGSIPTIN